MKNSLVYKLFIFVYVVALMALLVLPSLKYSVTYMEITILSLPFLALILITGVNYRKSFLQIILMLVAMAFLHYVLNSKGNISSVLNLVVTLYLCILSYFICRFLLDLGDEKLIKWVVIAVCLIFAFVFMKTLFALFENPTVVRNLATGDITDKYIMYQRMQNVGGFGFAYAIGLFIPYLTTIVIRATGRKKIIATILLVVLFVFAFLTQYTTLLILTTAFILYVLIKHGKTPARKIIAIAIMFIVILSFKNIVLFIAENTKLETLSWHFYDIYYSLGGGELESSRDEIYIKALSLFLENPIFGADLTNTYNATFANSSHSTFFARLVEGGIVGVALTYGAIGVCIKSIKSEIKSSYMAPAFFYLIVLSILNPITMMEIFVSAMLLIPLIEYLIVKTENEYAF